jgi:hypothetical protein
MNQVEVTYFILFAIIILLCPFFPTSVLLLLDNIVIRIAAILVLLYLVNIGPTVGIMGLMAFALLYLERNRRKVKLAAKKLDEMDVRQSRPATVQEASQPQKTVPVKPFDKPDHTETSNIPEDNTCDITNFEPVAPTINEKEVLASIYPLERGAPESGSASDDFFEQLGFGHVQGVETMGDSA